jgi:hypothetical protein
VLIEKTTSHRPRKAGPRTRRDGMDVEGRRMQAGRTALHTR